LGNLLAVQQSHGVSAAVGGSV